LFTLVYGKTAEIEKNTLLLTYFRSAIGLDIIFNKAIYSTSNF